MRRCTRLIAAILLSLVAAAAVRAPAAAADATTPTVTIRGATISTAAPEADAGALVVLRGSRPPPAPPRAPPPANACPAGYVELAGGDCMPADYVGQPEDVWGWPYVAGGRHQRRATHRPGRRAVGLAHGAVSGGGAVHR